MMPDAARHRRHRRLVLAVVVVAISLDTTTVSSGTPWDDAEGRLLPPAAGVAGLLLWLVRCGSIFGGGGPLGKNAAAAAAGEDDLARAGAE